MYWRIKKICQLSTVSCQLFRQSRAGFTLIEVLVASGILVAVVGASVRFGQIAIRSQAVALERAQAYHLIEEAMEVSHQIRDTNLRDEVVNPVWDEGLPTNGATSHPVWSGTSKRWTLDAGAETITLGGLTFERSVRLEALPAGLAPLADRVGQEASGALAENLRQIVVEVRWRSHGEDWQVIGRSLIGNWQGL